jgi:CRISPR/Cas system-associated endoribonuclease Cas2
MELAEKLKAALLGILNENEDSLIFFPVCKNCLDKTIFFGNKAPLQNENFEIL